MLVNPRLLRLDSSLAISALELDDPSISSERSPLEIEYARRRALLLSPSPPPHVPREFQPFTEDVDPEFDASDVDELAAELENCNCSDCSCNE